MVVGSKELRQNLRPAICLIYFNANLNFFIIKFISSCKFQIFLEIFLKIKIKRLFYF